MQAARLDALYPNGVLTETRVDLVMNVIPKPKPADLLLAMRAVLQEANERGITTVFDAGLGMGIGFYEVVLMQALAKTPLMTARMGAALFGNND